jgi:hypothetical protein
MFMECSVMFMEVNVHGKFSNVHESSVMFMERLCKQSETVNGCNAEQL